MPILSPHLFYRGLVHNGLIAWYDPGWQIITGQTGQTLIDRSGSGNHAQLGSTAGADANDPTWSTNCLSYSGTTYCQTPISITQEATIITVVNPPDLSVRRGFIGNRGGTNCRSYIYCAATTGAVKYGVASTGDIFTNITLTANEFACLMMRYSNGNAQGFKGITKTNLLNYTNTWGAAVQWDVGNAQLFYINGGNILVTVIYNRWLSDAEYLQIYSYLRHQMRALWGIAI